MFQGKTADLELECAESQPTYHHGNGPYNDINIPGCWFFRLPHKVSVEPTGFLFAAEPSLECRARHLRPMAGSKGEREWHIWRPFLLH